jgi:hypothetical protein
MTSLHVIAGLDPTIHPRATKIDPRINPGVTSIASGTAVVALRSAVINR